MQGPRDTYSRLLQSTLDCLIPEEERPSSSLLLYLVISFALPVLLSSVAIAVPQAPKSNLQPNLPLLWSAVSAPYLYNLIALPWKRLWRENGLTGTLVVVGGITLIMALPMFSLHLETAPDHPFGATLSLLVVNTVIGWMYHESIPDLIMALPVLTLAGRATMTFRPSPKVFPCAQQAVEDICRDMRREGKACSKALHYTRQVAENYLGGIEGQTLLWAILGAVIIDKAPPLLADLISRAGIPIMHENFWELLSLTVVGMMLLRVALHAFLHVHIIHAVEEYKLQHPEEE